MKPKTKYHHEVLRLHKALPDLTPGRVLWLKKQMYCYYYERVKDYTCTECNHTWKKQKDKKYGKTIICPKCGERLVGIDIPYQGKRMARSNYDYAHFQFITTFKKHQLIRCFYITKNVKVGGKAFYSIREVFQHWFSSIGQHAVMAINVNGMSYGLLWSGGTKMEIKTNHDRYYIGIPEYPKKRYIKELIRNDYCKDFHGYSRIKFYQIILGYPMAETLLKAGHDKLFGNFYSYKHDFKRFWPSIKIALRHGYDIEGNMYEWFDHIKLLSYFKKDLRSPRYICPTKKVFDKDHAMLVKRKGRIDEEKARQRMIDNAERELREIAKTEEIYKKHVSEFLELNIIGKNVDISVIASVTQLKEESDFFKHCGFISGYHKKYDSLMLTARKDGKPVETIQFSFNEKKVVQAEAFKRKPGKYHKEILALIKKNTEMIMKIYNSKLKNVA